MIDTNGTNRAAAGGEFGVNGEFYEGGKFLPSRADRSKTAPPAPLNEVELAARAARAAAAADMKARLDGWIAERRTKFADLLKTLLEWDRPAHLDTAAWKERIRQGCAGFFPHLGYQLLTSGNLSERQAVCVVKMCLGRETKKNSDEWNALCESLTETMPEAPAADVYPPLLRDQNGRVCDVG